VEPILRSFEVSDYDAAFALWTATPGMGLGGGDSREGITALLARNPGLSIAAIDRGILVGTALVAHDGRRGFIYHLAVAGEFRDRGLGRAMVERALERFREAGLTRCHIVVYSHNEQGRAFWRHMGFRERPDILTCSHDLP
jgi:ribosomal protein S18 acetylase RimI-like enzyme